MEASDINQEFYDKFSAELKNVEKKVAGEIDPGFRGIMVGVAVAFAFLTLFLTHAGPIRGVDILSDVSVLKENSIGLPARIFIWFFVIFDIGTSSLALLTRRWIFAWMAAAGSSLSVVFGVLSIWLRQTPGLNSLDPPKAGLGLWLELFIAIFLAFHWIRIVGVKTNYHLALEAERRELAKKHHGSDLPLLRDKHNRSKK